MPVLDALAAESLRYNYAHTVAPLTLPSHASMLTGLYPVRHRVHVNGPKPLPEEARTLAEVAREGGIQTAAFVAASVLNAPLGLSQGFEHFDAVQGQRQGEFRELERPAGSVVDAALEWFEARDQARPFFAWLHFFDPHAPYQPHPEFRGKTSNAYYDELAYVDSQLGRLVQYLRDEDLLERCVLLVVADHGESFGEHDEDTHGWLTYESALRVPFLLRYPDGLRAGEQSQEVISVVDVAPTLASAMQLSLGDELDGLSLFRSQVPEERGIYFESYQGYEAQRWSPIHGWLNQQGKYIHSSAPEWYDPRIDPMEKYNLVEGVDTSAYLDAIRELALRPRLTEAEPLQDEQQMEDIQALGYAAQREEEGRRPDLLEPTQLPSPAAMIQEERILRQAMALHTQRKFSEARPILEAFLLRNPNNPVAAEVLGYGYNSEGLYPQAEQVLRGLLQRGIRWPNVLFLLGHSLEQQGRVEEALEAYRDALSEDPKWKPALEALKRLG